MSRPSTWRKSTRSGNGGNCVETAVLNEVIGIRDSKDPDGPVLTLTKTDWTSLISTLKSR